MKEKVLLFHMEDEEILAKIQMILLLQHIGVRMVSMAEYCQPVGYLAGVKGMEAVEEEYAGPEFEEPMMVLCMNSGRIDQLLAAFRKAGVPRIAYKAMLTQTNRSWTPIELYGELKREHEAMHAGRSGGEL